jgi:hypothetical protein
MQGNESGIILEERLTMTDRLIKISKLVNLLVDVKDEEAQLRFQIKKEVDCQIREAITLSFNL